MSAGRQAYYDNLEGKTVAQLKQILRQNGLPIDGRKSELIDRIYAAGIYRDHAPRTTSPRRGSGLIGPPRPDVADTLRQRILLFIVGHFSADDIHRARTLSDWANGLTEDIFAQRQREELRRMDLPGLQFLEQLIVQLGFDDFRMVSMDKQYMGPSPAQKYDGFILMGGRIVMTHPR